MKRRLLAITALVLMGAGVAMAQSAASTSTASSSAGLDLLKRVAQRYADAKSYYIESVEERTQNGEYSRFWDKTVLTAAEAPGGRFYFEGQSGNGRAVHVADGKTVWDYRIDEHRYTVKTQLSPNATKPGAIAMTEMAILEAENLRKKLANLARPLNSADRLPDATLMVNGHPVFCQVIHFQNTDQKRVQGDYSFEKTIWIDAEHSTILKTVEHSHTFMSIGAAHIPVEQDATTLYPKTVLDGAVQDSLFTFHPPSDARLIQDFPDPMESFGSSMTGDQVPPLKLKSTDGTAVSLESLRGKPVLLDFWATWCAPCVAGLPQLAQIYQEGKDKGLVLLGVDRDEDATAASSFLARKGYTWPDFHDGDGEIEKLIGSSGIPRLVLVDGQGLVVYDGSDEDKLRQHIAKLGPEFQDLAPKPKTDACGTSK